MCRAAAAVVLAGAAAVALFRERSRKRFCCRSTRRRDATTAERLASCFFVRPLLLPPDSPYRSFVMQHAERVLAPSPAHLQRGRIPHEMSSLKNHLEAAASSSPRVSRLAHEMGNLLHWSRATSICTIRLARRSARSTATPAACLSCCKHL